MPAYIINQETGATIQKISSKIIREKELAIRLLRKLIAIAATRNLGGPEIKYAEDAMKVLEK